ncbi:hypothetical protein JCM10212_004256 [Sporobolomyces blumeae]
MPPRDPSDSYEFELLYDLPRSPPTRPAAFSPDRTSAPSTSPPVASPPSSPNASPRRLVKRAHANYASQDAPGGAGGGSPRSPPWTPPSPDPFSTTPRSSPNPGRQSSASRERSPVIAPHESLVADVQMSRTRVILSKTHTAYDVANVPWRSAVIGFRVTFHSPPSSSARVRGAEVGLRFVACDEDDPHPVIKAITPASSGVGPSTSVETSIATTAGVRLGYTPYGTLELSRTSSSKHNLTTQARISSSGVETNELWLTLEEDPATKQGIPSTVDFAVLLQLTSPPPFEAEMRVCATVGRGPQALRNMLSTPREWRVLYDGETLLSPVDLSPSPEPNRRASIPSGMVIARSQDGPDDDDGRFDDVLDEEDELMEEARRRREATRVQVKRRKTSSG